MKTNVETAEKIWIAYFGNVEEAHDAFGVLLYRKKHGLVEDGGWEVDHIWPKNPKDLKHGANTLKNVQPLNHEANADKSNNLQGKANGISFSIHKISDTKEGVIGRMAIFKNGTWYWGYNEPAY